MELYNIWHTCCTILFHVFKYITYHIGHKNGWRAKFKFKYYIACFVICSGNAQNVIWYALHSQDSRTYFGSLGLSSGKISSSTRHYNYWITGKSSTEHYYVVESSIFYSKQPSKQPGIRQSQCVASCHAPMTCRRSGSHPCYTSHSILQWLPSTPAARSAEKHSGALRQKGREGGRGNRRINIRAPPCFCRTHAFADDRKIALTCRALCRRSEAWCGEAYCCHCTCSGLRLRGDRKA